MQRNQLLPGLVGFVLGASVVGALTTPSPARVLPDQAAQAGPSHPGAVTAQEGADGRPPRAPDYTADPAGAGTSAVELSPPARAFARTMALMLERRWVEGEGFDPEAFRRQEQALFCEFDGAMNAMSTTERQQAIDGLGFTRDVLVGKNHLEFHSCALPRHADCPNEAVPGQ